MRTVGPENLFLREHKLLNRCIRGLRKAGMEAFAGEHQAATVSFRCGLDCEDAAAILARNGIAVRAGLHCAPFAHESAGTLETGTVRVSIGYGTFEEEITTFLRAVLKLTGFSE